MEPRRSSIELLLDEHAEERVRAEWAALADAGLSSLGRHESPSNRPHVTLLARAGLPAPLRIDAALPLPLVLGPPTLLGAGDRRVLVRAVLPSAALLALHEAVHDAAGPGDDDPHVRPGAWLPHVSLARRLRLADLPAALTLLGEPIAATGVAVRHWDPASAELTTLAST